MGPETRNSKQSVNWDEERLVEFISWDVVEVSAGGVPLCPVCRGELVDVTEQFGDALQYADAFVCRWCGKLIVLDALTRDEW